MFLIPNGDTDSRTTHVSEEQRAARGEFRNVEVNST